MRFGRNHRDQDPAVASSLRHVTRYRLREIRIVAGGVAASTIIDHFVAFPGKPLAQFFFQRKSGMIGANWGVEWCVTGTDRDWAYNPGCAMAQP